MKLLHMITSLPDRTPTFTMFGDDNFFDETSSTPTKDCSHYVHDGRVLVEKLDSHALPASLKDGLSDYIALAQAYKQINATKGPVGVNSLVFANGAITDDNGTYGKYLTTIGAITDERNALASQMIDLLNGAAFGKQPIRGKDGADDLVERAQKLVDKVEDVTKPGH